MGPSADIDEHVRLVAAAPERTWAALLAVLAGTFRRLPAPVAAAWGLVPSAPAGDWGDPHPGDAITGFAVTEIDPPRLLVLGGRHRFSRYALRFALEPAGPGRVELRARSSAEFPGPLGRLYQALVISSGGHVVAVRTLLARVARRAGGG